MIELNNVSYTYNDADEKAIRDVSLKANDGELLLVTGISGCGKSTLIRLINGLCPHYFGGVVSGQITTDSQVYSKDLGLDEISKRVGTLFQDPERQFFALNVEDEIAFALEWMNLTVEEIKNRVESVIKRFKLEDIRGNSISSLSEGQKQKVGLAQIVAMHSRNIILDEPTANLDPQSTAELATFLGELKEEGYCILVVDHRLYWLHDVADNVVVMEHGSVVHTGDFSSLNDEALRTCYNLRNTLVTDIRDSLEDCFVKENISDDTDVVVRAQHLAFTYKNGKTIFKDYSFSLPSGITLLVGDNGIGKTTLCRLMFGLEKLNQGKITFTNSKGKDAQDLCAIVLQNADYQLHMQTVYKEVETCLELALQDKSSYSVNKLLEKFALTDLAFRHPQSLSGGQKQRLVIACAIAKNPAILILDEPTSGLDGKNMQRIKSILTEQAELGKAVLVITHDLELMDKNFKALRMTIGA